MRVTTLFSTLFFAKYLHVVEDGPGRGHLCHTDTFLVFYAPAIFIGGERGAYSITAVCICKSIPSVRPVCNTNGAISFEKISVLD